MVETAEIEPRSEGSIQGAESTQNSAKVVQFSVLQKSSGAFTPAESPTTWAHPETRAVSGFDSQANHAQTPHPSGPPA